MSALTPWTGLTGLRQEMDRLFDRFFEPRWAEAPELGEWLPRLDISETKDAVTVKIEIPGVPGNPVSRLRDLLSLVAIFPVYVKQ